jgi:DNA invertase Pin-like site-specific DNA recombinase
MIYGYCRISTKKQNVDRQIRNIKAEFPSAVIVTEAYTGTKLDRPEFNKLHRKLKSGDTVVFDEVSRMSRNAKEGFALYWQLYNMDINLIFLKEPYVNTDSYKESMQGVFNTEIQSGDNATDNLVNSIMAAVNRFMMNKVEKDIQKAFEQAQKEVDYLHQRIGEGIETARLNGKQIGLAKGSKLTTKKSISAKEIIKKHNKKFGGTLSNEETWKLAGISKMSFYKYSNELKNGVYQSV